MTEDNKTYAGGCQCGAVRFQIKGSLGDASVCHCRMCQKAFGGFYAPLVSVCGAKLSWTRGNPKQFKSSNFATRGFCGDCGTPLTYEAPDGVALAIGAFDEPQEIVPIVQYGVEGKLPYTDTIPTLTNKFTQDDLVAAYFLNEIISHQHPDHDTETWPYHYLCS